MNTKMLLLPQLNSASVKISNFFPIQYKDSLSHSLFFRALQLGGISTKSSSIRKISTSNNIKLCRAAIQEKTEALAMEEKVRRNGHPELMIVSDLDFTMVDHDDHSHQSLLNFNSLWAAEYANNSTLVFSTGRTPERYSELRRQVPLLTPEVVVLSVGTEIFYGQSLEPDRNWQKLLDEGWDRDIVIEEAKMFPQLQFQEDSDQGPYKISFYLDKEDAPDVQQQLLSRLEHRGLKVKLMYSAGIAFDVLPKMGGKGEALAYLMRKMKNEGWLSKNVLVCGDSGNDTELFLVEGVKGVIVCFTKKA